MIGFIVVVESFGLVVQGEHGPRHAAVAEETPEAVLGIRQGHADPSRRGWIISSEETHTGTATAIRAGAVGRVRRPWWVSGNGPDGKRRGRRIPFQRSPNTNLRDSSDG